MPTILTAKHKPSTSHGKAKRQWKINRRIVGLISAYILANQFRQWTDRQFVQGILCHGEAIYTPRCDMIPHALQH